MAALICALLALTIAGSARAVEIDPSRHHGGSGGGSSTSCNLGFKPGTTVIFVADPGTFSSTPEAAQYLKNLKNSREIPAGSFACAEGFVGTMMRQNVAVIETGIGPTFATVCVYDVLERCGSLVKDVFYSGTSGWSPQLGGIINNGSCEAGNFNKNNQIVRIGDVCVSPFSVSWDCRQASYGQTCATGGTNQCVFPAQNSFGPGNPELFGQCEYTNVSTSQLALAEEVIAAATAKASKLPTANSVVQSLNGEYWAKMSQGVGFTFDVKPKNPPRVWTYKQCMEVSSQYFWSGAPWDMVARDYAAQTLNAALGTKQYSQENMLTVSAMEAIGVGTAMQRYTSLSTSRRRIPYVVVRGTSNWVHSPLVKKANGVWEAGPIIDNFDQGYKYAISTGSAVVMTTLQARCEKGAAAASAASGAVGAAGGGGRPRLPTPVESCNFTIDYS